MQRVFAALAIAALSFLAGEAGDGLGTRIEHWLLKRMSASMQIESLWYFNAKYDPSWHPRFAVYDGPEHVRVEYVEHKPTFSLT